MDHSTQEVDISLMLKASDAKVRAEAQEWKAIAEKREERKVRRRQYVSPPGTLGLEPLLDKRRVEFEIPDCVFRFAQPVYDRVFLYQLPFFEQDMYGDAKDPNDPEKPLIVLTDTGKDIDKNTTPRGLLIAAGLTALDRLHAHGIEIGHIVNFVKYTQWRMRVGLVEGQEEHIIPMLDRDIIASEDLRQELYSKEPAKFITFDTALCAHFIEEAGGTVRKRHDAPESEEA